MFYNDEIIDKLLVIVGNTEEKWWIYVVQKVDMPYVRKNRFR